MTFIPQLERLSSVLSRRALLSFAGTVAVLALTTDSVYDLYATDENHGPVTAWTWASAALAVYSVVLLFWLPSRVPAPRRAFVRWWLAISPWLFGCTAVILGGSPVITLWVALAASVLLLGWAALVSREA